MLRSIKSGQRKMRVLALKVTANSLSGPDKLKASVSNYVVTFDVPFAEPPVVIVQSQTGMGTVLTVTASGFTVSEDCDVIVIGSDTSEKY